MKKQLPDCEIHFLTKPQYKVILENNPYIDRLHLLDTSDLKKALELKNENFDFIIDLHNNIRTLIFKSVLNVISYPFEKLNLQKWLLVNFKINELPDIHIVGRYLKTVAPLGVYNDGKGLDYFIPSTVSVENLPDTFIVFVIGGNHFTKKLPNEKIISICKGIDKKIILLGGKEDETNGDEIANASGSHVINLCGKLSLNESAFVIKHSEKAITHDTGLMHIAAAFQKEIISIWGNTVPEFGMTPYYGKSEVGSWKSEVGNLDCRPCSKIGFDKCPKGHFKCMMMQDTEQIISSA